MIDVSHLSDGVHTLHVRMGKQKNQINFFDRNTKSVEAKNSCCVPSAEIKFIMVKNCIE